MRLTIPKPQFLKTLQVVERAVNDRSTLPILANVLLESTEQEITLTATDLDVGIQCRFPLAQPGEKGAVALPARKLTAIVRELPEESVLLEAKKNHTATVSCGGSTFRIPGLPPEDFPILPPAQSDEMLRVPQEALKSLVELTAHAMSVEETRFILNGALLVSQKDALVMVATDGRRLALAETPLTQPAKQPLQVVVPAKTIRELGRLLQEEEMEDVVIAPLKDNQLTFRFGAITIVTRLIEGQYPQYDKVVPAPIKAGFGCRRSALIDAIRRASLMTTMVSQAVTFELSANKLVVSKESSELGSVREELDVAYSGNSMRVAFNPEFWIDALKVTRTEEIYIELSSPDRPAVLRLPGFTYLVLPMKVA
ncbi:MAG: DNA polymerase III subunit beta [Candidatus Omnitrophica bacterium]|nr:DNA polymerase III subunit beta [Candidatus Omnitrophota bacterium]MBI3010306.1 DNA polymerase III subunit beta [Candidatus Omnitrophota bacterium]